MDDRANVWGRLICLGSAGLLFGCATDTLEHPSYWWNATVVSVERASELAPGIDRTCVAERTGGAPSDERPVIVVLYRVGKAPVTKAYVEAKGDQWRGGDRALVHPNTCRIKRAPTATGSRNADFEARQRVAGTRL